MTFDEAVEDCRAIRGRGTPETWATPCQGGSRAFDPRFPLQPRCDVPKADVHILDGGHFALDTAADEIARLIRGFIH